MYNDLRKIYNKSSINASGTLVIVMGIFFCFFFLFGDFGWNVAYGGILIALAIIAYVTIHNKSIKIKLSKGYTILCVSAIVILINMRDVSFFESNPFYVFAMIATLVILPISAGTESCKNKLLSIMLSIVFLIALIPILSRLFPKFYTKKILVLLSGEAKNYNLTLLQLGYSGSVGAYISLTANYVVIGIAIAVSRFKKCKIKHLLMIAYFLFSLLCLNRRSEIIACVFSIILIVFLSAKRQRRAIIFCLCLCFVLLSAIFIFINKSLLLSYSGSNRILISISDLLKHKDISNGRSLLYEIAWDLFCKHPLFGVGFGQFRKEGGKILSNVTNVHNIYLQLLCELGILGACIIYFALFILAKQSYKMFLLDKTKTCVSSSCFSFFMVIYILVVGFFDNPIFQDTFWLLLCIIVFCIKKKPILQGEKI